MTRKEFIKIFGLLGVTLPLQNILISCDKNEELAEPFSGKVIIIGAGAGGLSTGYLLKQQGIDFQILEASSAYGGRMKINTDFADFPIPLGAEWLETNPNVLQDIINEPSVMIDIQTVSDDLDFKFIDYSWFNFFTDYIVPSISPHISYNTIVQSIDYSGSQITVNTQNGPFTADKVVISVPLKVLKDKDILFTPTLPQSKADALNDSKIWEGFKAFFEFSTNFYGEGIEISSDSNGEKIYYDASFGQKTTKNIIGLLAVGTPALDYIHLSESQLKDFILNELDGLYFNQASTNYIGHITQNWTKEPFIKGGYLTDYADWKTVKELGKPISNKLYFAGSEYTDGEDWVSVHTAAQSAKKVVHEINS